MIKPVCRLERHAVGTGTVLPSIIKSLLSKHVWGGGGRSKPLSQIAVNQHFSCSFFQILVYPHPQKTKSGMG